MKSVFQFLSVVVISLISATSLSAQNPQVKGQLTATDLGTQLQVCFDIAGLGNVSMTKLTVNFTAVATTECTNKGGNVAPGQTKTVSGSQDFMVTVRNGRTGFQCVKTDVPAPGKCPGGFAGGTVTDVQFSNVSISVAGSDFPVN
jgi:hypothetical protein